MPSLITVLKTATLHVIKATDVRGQDNINLNKKEINKNYTIRKNHCNELYPTICVTNAWWASKLVFILCYLCSKLSLVSP